MNPATDRFIELITRPLGGNAELQLAAAGELRKSIEKNAASPEVIQEAVESLERADRHPRRHGWRPALYLTTLLISLPVLAHSLWQVRQLGGIGHLVSPTSGLELAGLDATKYLTPAQKLLLHGDQSASDQSGRWKPLWDSEPENPAYLLEYARAFHSEHHTLSPEILEAAAHIDPENAWYPVIQAAGNAKSAIKKESPGYYARQNGAKPKLTVIDEEAYTKALAQLHQAKRLPRISADSPELMKQRIPMLPARVDTVSQLPRAAYLLARTAGTIDFRYLADALAIQAGRCAEQHDIAGFRQLVEDGEWLSSAAAKGGSSFIDLLVARAVFTTPLSAFSDAARALGLEQEALKFTALHQQEEARRGKSRRDDPDSRLVETKSSVMAALMLPAISRQVATPPPLTEEDFRPGRHADHAFFGRIHALAAWLLLGLCAGLAALGRFRSRDIARMISLRLQDLFRFRDWAWVFLGGMIAPLLWGFAIIHFTPLSAREWSLRSAGLLLPCAQLGSVTILMLVTSAVIAAGCLRKRAGFLWPDPRLPKLGWLAVACTALAIPMAGSLMLLPGGLGQLLFQGGCLLSGLPLLWLVWGFCCHVLEKPVAGWLRRAMLARMVIPVWILGMLLMTATVPFHYAAERRWIQQDRLLEVTAEMPAPSRYEWDATQVLRKELLELME